ncbi:MAG: DUF5696 domain-containing protein, partial [Planctomycetaceae bacterium]|nr:DUF5696 domain-containing protein [Planctomycetaceae bacterium]
MKRSAFLLTFFILLSALFFCGTTAYSYTTWRISEGPLNLYFGKPDEPLKLGTFTETEKPQTFYATLQNTSDAPVSLKLKFRTIETIEFPEAEQINPDELPKTLELKAKETQTVPFQAVARKGTLTAHYPIYLDVEYVQSGKSGKTGICLVLETTIANAAVPKNPLLGQLITDGTKLPLNILPERGGLVLPALDTYRAFWYYDNKPEQILPVGWQGGEEKSRAHIQRHQIAAGGEYRYGLNMHPPYHNGIGNAGVEYRIQLPPVKLLTLSFFSAVRTVEPPETPSDGVTFRVLVNGEKVYEKHNAETVWVANEADLSKFAGKTVLLRLESDPGPKRNTNCDSCFWGDVLLFAGKPADVVSADEKANLFEENLTAVKTGKAASDKTKVFPLDGGLTAAVSFGKNGFLDGIIGFGNAEKQVQFDGIKVWCKGQLIGQSPSVINAGQWVAEEEQNPNAPPKPATKKQTAAKKSAGLSWAQDITINGATETLFFALRRNGAAVQFDIDASDITILDRIEFGAATQHAPRVYFGHGYCIEEPENFTVGAGGHGLSTSHAGMDFANGLSVLQASSFPVDRFTVSPEKKIYTLSVHPSTTLTLLPGLNGALDCAVRYRPLTGNVPASGFETKKGRFVFDIWGGQYKQHTEVIKNAVKYGVTDSLFIVHSWQRWGYDNVLPDIFPPNPRMGTLADMQETLTFADKHGIQYGVHDNYIDFYPDAEDYNFDVITFYENGQPKKAWNNYGIEAQSYQFRPDKVAKFLNRNLDLLTKHLPVSTYFIDVFTSLDPVDYYDRDGNFHSRAETQQHWAQTFDTVRNRLSK